MVEILSVPWNSRLQNLSRAEALTDSFIFAGRYGAV